MTLVLVESTATISACGRYRYDLTRRWADGPTVCWTMLNPSTADASQNDPTIRRCIDFSKRWGAGGLVVVNLFAYRATKPAELLRAADPGCGEENVGWVKDHVRRADATVVAWGAHPAAARPDVRPLIGWLSEHGVLCLGRTAAGCPRHPLLVKATTPLEVLPWLPYA